ncbi:GntR family transcriptional regulator [Streptomyces gobiensis]|uniref:GntR family transcriptional regulator n=1 Tax=Streptomyces gobiensis TaxID=2875706 RepID=UPI001E41F9D4|nr:GntR family transcriptional regulator [Streptomyces gobiensis]UGY94256.1 GntR family transcriptional regulator [Streptomyces gobiensis]
MEQTRAESAIRAGLDAAVPAQRQRSIRRIPAVPPIPAARSGQAGAEAARGEHTHCEPPAPQQLPRRHSVRAQVLSALRESLLCGELRPGEVYSAPSLAERFGVSPTPVREAMQQLASEGAVQTMPNRGFRVAEHSDRELAELGEVRALLEVPTVLRLARVLPAERWQALRPLADLTVTRAARGDRAGYADADRAFHAGLLELTGNRQLVLVAEDLRRRAQRPVGRASDLLAAASEHVALIDALCAGDATAAERVLRAHLSH